MKSSSSSSSAETTERLKFCLRKMEEQKEKQTLAVIAETYAIEIGKLKEKVEMYEKARFEREDVSVVVGRKEGTTTTTALFLKAKRARM